MSDGTKSNLGQLAQDIGEAIFEPVKDQVGQAIEEGVQSVIGIPTDPQTKPQPAALDPAVRQQRRADENQKKAEWNWRLQQYQKLEQQQKVDRQRLQQQAMKKQEEEKEEKKVEQFKIIEKDKKSQSLAAQQAARKTEIRGGVGG